MSSFLRLSLLLLLLAVGAFAEDQPQWIPTTANDAALLRSSDSPQEFEDLVVNATLSAAFSGCGLCQQTGQCDRAFRGQPARRAQQAREEQTQFAYAQPVATGQYGTYPGQPQDRYAYASAPAAYESSPYHENGGGGNTMAAGALGALGGLGVGAALGSMWGRNEGGYNNPSNVSDNTYSFSGDTGGGDFVGDGGDDTFAGDS
ncbi:hypothetical protein BBJ29_009647 [Phytophthora kernoviae]|uniref:Uncharacterized protein n=2 Tax=Phytophthora kernoviae TaxID=325452 RepID=A0A3R7GNY6_9STRA|nr:hypothetical protein BBJ29_009647 [Phytophthora kernoviae]